MRALFSAVVLASVLAVSLLLCAPAVGQEGNFPVPIPDEFSIDPPPGGAPQEAAQLKEAAQEILSRPEFRRVHGNSRGLPDKDLELPKWEWPTMPQWLRDIGNWIIRMLTPLFRMLAQLLYGIPWIMYILLVALVGVLAYVIARVISNMLRSRTAEEALQKFLNEGEAELGPGETPADIYVQRAREFAENGQFREAIGMLLLGAMSTSERAGWIRHRRGLTHRDYLRAMRSQEQSYVGFKTMVSIFEPICFGRRDAYREHYDVSLENYERGFSTVAEKAI